MNTLPNLPLGFIAMFPGENIPEGWRICNGTYIHKNEIPHTFDELAKILNSPQKKNNSSNQKLDENINEEEHTPIVKPPDNMLQLPNLSDRFIVGAGMDAQLQSSGEPDQHTHKNDPPPQRRYTSYGDQFIDAASTQYFKEKTATISNVNTLAPEKDTEMAASDEDEDFSENIAPISLEHHNHYVELDIDPFESEASEGLNRPKYYALHFVIKVA